LVEVPLVEMRNISKSFGSIRAVQSVDLKLYHKEILGIVGDNAAGKSTLMKILMGVFPPDEGEIFINGKRVEIMSPMDARSLGIEMVYQDFALVPCLDVKSNMFMARELTKNILNIRVLDKRNMERRSQEILKRLHMDVNPNMRVSHLSGGQQQAVSIGRAILFSPKIIIMDEPSASLSIAAIDRLLQLTKYLRDEEGISAIFITHRIPDVFKVADRVMVMRAGRKIAERHIKETSIDEIVRLMLEAPIEPGIVTT
jgi:ABC-type sugar transport system ATPase subunit